MVIHINLDNNINKLVTIIEILKRGFPEIKHNFDINYENINKTKKSCIKVIIECNQYIKEIDYRSNFFLNKEYLNLNKKRNIVLSDSSNKEDLCLQNIANYFN